MGGVGDVLGDHWPLAPPVENVAQVIHRATHLASPPAVGAENLAIQPQCDRENSPSPACSPRNASAASRRSSAQGFLDIEAPPA